MARTHSVALIACTLAALSPFRTDRNGPQLESLLNQSADVALDCLGPPSQIRPSTSGLTTWVWPKVDGAPRSITLYGDRVVALEPRTLGEGRRAPGRRVKAPYAGQPLEELIQDLGHPDRALNVPLSTAPPGAVPPGRGHPTTSQPTLVYGEDWVSLFGGRVLSVGSEPRVKVTGPR